MSNYSEAKEIVKDIKKDKVLVWLLRAIGLIVVITTLISIVVFCVKIWHGEPAKLLFGLADFPGSKNDTVVKYEKGRVDTLTTLKVPEKVPELHSKKRTPVRNQQLPSPVHNPDTTIKNETNSTGNNAHIVNGNNNHVEVNGDILNGVRQRHLNDAVRLYLRNQLPDKAANITVSYPADKEGSNYGMEIYNWLRDQGFVLIRRSFAMGTQEFEVVKVEHVNNYYTLIVYPTSNTGQ